MISFKSYLEEVTKPTGKLKKACCTGYTAVGTKQKGGRTVPNCVPEETEIEEHIVKSGSGYKLVSKKTGKNLGSYPTKAGAEKRERQVQFFKHQHEETELEELFDIIEEVVDGIAEENDLDPDVLWENLEDVTDEELYETAAWRRKEGKSATGGLNRKGIMSYRRENPGSKLKMAVTGKVKPGSKAAKRRKSFCARMSGMKGAMKKPNGEPTRKALALRKWKCR